MKKILINALLDERWIGGLYYTRNILFSLLQNEYIKSNYEIIVHSFKGNEPVFKDFKRVKQYFSPKRNIVVNFLADYLFRIINRVDITFPLIEKQTFLKKNYICWIPDFQHKYYPEFFEKKELIYRDRKFKSYINNKYGIVFSSKDSLKDFKKYYSSKKKNVYVVPFVSYIEPIIRKLSRDDEIRILKKYGLFEKKYTCIMNQFWQHKNHKIVFDAMEYLFANYDDDLHFVFTGKMEDYRKPEYIGEIKKIIDNPNISSKINMLGYISREDQIVIMKNALFVTQPSLFEGWGTVVEDAKVLDKRIILSDIPIHKEQKNEKCILFNPYDAKELAKLYHDQILVEQVDDYEEGIKNMYKRAKIYSTGFEQLLKDIEKIKG